MKQPSQLYRKLKLWDAGLSVLHRLILIAGALVALAGALRMIHPGWWG